MATGSAGCAPPIPPSPQWIDDAKFVSTQAGESVLVFAATGALGARRRSLRNDTYLRRHSLETGAVVASVEFDYRQLPVDLVAVTCEPALPGRLWCFESSAGGLKVLDTGSLQTLAVQNQMLRGTPGLAGEPPFKHMRVDPKTRGFVFESRDGYAWIIDPTTLAPARFDGTVDSIPEVVLSRPPSDTGTDTGYHYDFIGGSRKTLVGHGPSTKDDIPLHPEHTYLHGRIVRRLDNPPRVLVLEDVVDHGPTLWCLFADGTAQWKVENLAADVDLVTTKLTRDTVVLVTHTMLIAIRTQDGAVVWTSPP